MASGDLTVTVVGTYATAALAATGASTVNLAAATDRIEICYFPTTPAYFVVFKIARAP